MREKLKQYIDILFQRAALTIRNAELHEEILQNTLDRFDDLLREGKSEEEAYRITVDGVGDLSGLIELAQPSAFTAPLSDHPAPVHPNYRPVRPAEDDASGAEEYSEYAAEPSRSSRIPRRGAQAGVWLLTLVAYFLVSFQTGAWYLTWVLFLLAPALCWLVSPEKTRGSAISALWLLAVAVYIFLSFQTGNWHLTWIVFLIAAAATGLVRAIYDYREEAV